MKNYMQKIIIQHISQQSIILMALLRAGRLQLPCALSKLFLFIWLWLERHTNSRLEIQRITGFCE